MDVEIAAAGDMQDVSFLTSAEVLFAVGAVRRAARLAQSVQLSATKKVLNKADQSPVTVADFAVQALIAGMLQESFPDDPLVAEEDSESLRTELEGPDLLGEITSLVQRYRPEAKAEQVCEWIDQGTADPCGRFWTLDPIDGTKGFLRGDQFATALALIEDGQVQLGVLGCPNIRQLPGNHAPPAELVVSCRGQGTWSTGLSEGESLRRLRVSSSTLASRARVVRSVEAAHTDGARLEEFRKLLGAVSPPVMIDSQVKYVYLAEGRADLLLRLPSPARITRREKIWDHCAGWLVCNEAGGQVTDLRGWDLDFTQGRTLAQNVGILASNGYLHTAALETLRRITPSSDPLLTEPSVPAG